MESRAQFLLDLGPSPAGRLEGWIEDLGRRERLPFSGTLELLKAIEDALVERMDREGAEL